MYPEFPKVHPMVYFLKPYINKSARIGEPLHQKAKEKWETQQLRSQDKQAEEEHELSECEP